MNVVLSVGSPARPSDAAVAQERYRALAKELERVRAAAVAWRNGLAGVLAALVGFGLIRGRSDIGELAAPWHMIVGLLLLAALFAGGAAAYWLLRAANGRPALTPVDYAVTGVAADHLAAGTALTDLRRGIVTSLACGALLVGAVGTTWYGPQRAAPKLRVQIPGNVHCGSVAGVEGGRLRLTTEAGQVTVDLAQAVTVQPVDGCP